MTLVLYKENTRTRRFASKLVKPGKNFGAPKNLKVLLKKKSGRGAGGRVSVRHQGGRHKRYYRLIDFRRDKFNVEGEVAAFEYDPNRNVNIALINYEDGDKRYILAPAGLKVGDKVLSGDKVEVKVGNALPLKNVVIGTIVHNVELTPGRGGQFGRSAGAGLVVQSKEAGYAHLKMPSGEIRMVSLEARATIGQLGNEDAKNIVLGKAGRKRHMGIRPSVRGVAMDPGSHPHGGGEGRSGVGRKKPMTKYGRPAVGKTRKKNKWTSKYILKRRGK
ncbi:MAG: 50S ribosomal protein L2 [uncultured bacterium]|uniref:Large ribosomal subunit protein uL2 n=4 Tax=Candidatus Daviesiibacteriota TaxID=1752718 RepID=A0A0G0I2R2_9BACT|nr:MAG: 50S ribosomal protein L2 [uncultured bacterium]KKQ10401.1 MAG: 50S ribosomal protein L2 [Candidatus Daviesbacteria bacterium GW2011_GWB1_36_5]KKQ15780.1 MAG: 50S ribosomal protein L2 [Candidatus Daviesbacteria bacterium GW2011_GWA1_36_8]OGE16705.1 MAG: 50S ribosomal protein L2 [Candidatus Daviesbacteria bacterium RIFCSPHIGHO2_01_FULL_36_37]OGE31770.1 MAG: 50S ribosomal protein L2 [Candidatus Daviesbacteria bacterium RIFCSPHIGHO2_02_FULL_37_9]OGE34782.1 MAG: 50S ribosomal protein L2 [Ca